jgi:hypothetical protein
LLELVFATAGQGGGEVFFEFSDAVVGLSQALGHDLGEEAEEDGVVSLAFFGIEVVKEFGIDLDAVDVVEGAGGGGAGEFFLGVEECEFADEFAGGIDAGNFFAALADEKFTLEEDEERGVLRFLAFFNDHVTGIAFNDGGVGKNFIETGAADRGKERDLGKAGREFAWFVVVGNFSHGLDEERGIECEGRVGGMVKTLID